MQSAVIVPKVGQAYGFFSPSSGRLILGRAVEVYSSVEGRCRDPLELFGWVMSRLLFVRRSFVQY